MRKTTVWGPIRSVRLTAHPAIGCAAASSSDVERLRFTWNCDSPWWSVHPGAPTTAAVRRPLTCTTTRQTPTRPRPLTRPGWRTHTPRYVHAHPLTVYVNMSQMLIVMGYHVVIIKGHFFLSVVVKYYFVWTFNILNICIKGLFHLFLHMKISFLVMVSIIEPVRTTVQFGSGGTLRNFFLHLRTVNYRAVTNDYFQRLMQFIFSINQ